MWQLTRFFVKGFGKYFAKCLLILHLPQCLNRAHRPGRSLVPPTRCGPTKFDTIKNKSNKPTTTTTTTATTRQGKQMSTTKQTSFFVYCLHCFAKRCAILRSKASLRYSHSYSYSFRYILQGRAG